MELTYQKDQELRRRARDWFYYIGFSSNDIDDIIQEAMIRLYRWYEDHTELEMEDFADKTWRKCLRNTWVDWVRKTGSYSKLLERYADIEAEHQKREHYIEEARHILLDVLPKLSDTELIVLIALMDNGFNKKWSAEDLGCHQSFIYRTLHRIRDRHAKDYDFTHNPHSQEAGAEVEYLWKEHDYYLTEGTHWNMSHASKTEVFDVDAITQREFRDLAEEAKVWPVTIIKGADYGK